MCDRLMGGELAPGEKISLRHLADGLGTSVMPVREAVSRLVADGALAVSPNRAVAVPVMTLPVFCELTTVRVAIEGFAAEQAAFAHTAADLARITEHAAIFRAECERCRPNGHVATTANRDLHFSIYAAAELPTLVGIIRGLWLKIGPVLSLDMKTSPQRLSDGAAFRHHARCVEAIAKRDGRGARTAIRDDIEQAAAFIAATGRLPKA